MVRRQPHAGPWGGLTAGRPFLAPLSLRANFGWTFAGNLVYALSQWAIVVVLAKLLPPAALGRFALGLAITAPVVLLTNLQLRAVQATDARREHAFGDYLGLRLASTGLALLAIGLVAVVVGGETGVVVGLIGVAKAFEALSDIGYGLLQLHERMDPIARSMMMRGGLSAVAVWVVVATTESLPGAALAMAGSFGLVLVVYDVPVARRMAQAAEGERGWAPRWSVGTLRNLAWLALPLGMAVSLVSLTANIPRYVVERELGEAELGVFAAIAYLIVAGNTVVTALGQAASPRLAKDHAAGERTRFVALTARMLAMAAGLGAAGFLVAAVAGRPLLRLLYTEEYARLDVLLWLVAAATAMFLAAFLGYAMTAARAFRPQLPLFVATTAVVVVASFGLIPELGLPGAALALVVAAGVQITGSVLILARALRAT